MTRLRWRIARWLVGPFVTIPEHDGVWVVHRDGKATMTFEADRYRLKSGFNVTRNTDKAFGSTRDLERMGLGTRWGRFVGTVKYR